MFPPADISVERDALTQRLYAVQAGECPEQRTLFGLTVFCALGWQPAEHDHQGYHEGVKRDIWWWS